MKVLLSIKPEFAEKIFSGEKKFEFRRSIFKDKTVKTVLVYASASLLLRLSAGYFILHNRSNSQSLR